MFYLKSSPFSRLWLPPGFLCSLDGEAAGFRVWPRTYDILGNNFGFSFPGVPSPATLKVPPNSDSCFHDLFSHICHSGLDVDLDSRRRHFSGRNLSGMPAGGDWWFSRFGFVQTGENGGFCRFDFSIFQCLFLLSALGLRVELVQVQVPQLAAVIRYLPSLQIQFLCTVCTAGCRM